MRRIVCFSCRKSPADGAELRNRRICWLCVDCWAGFARIGGRLARRAAFSIAIAATKAHAHSFWSNGEEVPAWTKSYCCGPSDVHRLEPSAVHIMPDGYHIDGIKTIVPMDYRRRQAGGVGSHIAGNRSQLRRGVVAEIDHHRVGIAPGPALRRVISLDDRVFRRVIMGGCVPVGRIVAATDMAAGPAKPQMDPAASVPQAILAAPRARRDPPDRSKMRAGPCHDSLRKCRRGDGMSFNCRAIMLMYSHVFRSSDSARTRSGRPLCA